MLLAVVADDVRAGIGLVAQHLIAGLGGKGVQQLLGEAVREGGQRLGAEQPRNFPMPDGGVLAGAGFAQAGKAAQGRGGGRAALYAVDVEQAQLGKMPALEGGVGGDAAQRVGAGIPERGGVRLCPDAEAVENDQENSFCHSGFSLTPMQWVVLLVL